MDKLDALLIICLIGIFSGVFLDNDKAFYAFMIIFGFTAGYWITQDERKVKSKSPAATK